MSWFRSLFGSSKTNAPPTPGRVFFHNSLSGSKELFVPVRPGEVSMYSCGPTVYGPAHVGNLRAYVFSDTITRVLVDAGLKVRRVINITDVGHLVGDGDEGEDKMAVGAAREKKTPEEIANHYTKLFLNDLDDLNLDTRHILFPRATEYIKEQIAFAKTLEEKGFAYRTSDGLYFDTSKFPSYGALGGMSGAHLKEGARVAVNREKKHPNDFALWRLAKPKDLQQWDSPWGRGNPGWHLECSTMSRSLLGSTLDIHTGGEDHIATHHNNEIAQSEAANGRPFVRYWMHLAFLSIGGEKIAKSVGNIAYLSDVIEKGYHPLALRYFFLQAHYRTPVSFSYQAIASSDEALKRLWRIASEIRDTARSVSQDSEMLSKIRAAIRDDLATPHALGLLWEGLKSDDLSPEEKWGLIETSDRLLGLSLTTPPVATEPVPLTKLPVDIQTLVAEREAARAAKDFNKADRLREALAESGYRVEDSPKGPLLTPRG